MKLPSLKAPTELPGVGVLVPALAIRVALVIAGVLLSLVDYGFNGWLALGIVLSVAAAVIPQALLAWVLVLYLAAGRFSHHASVSWQFLVVLAGVHLLCLLGMLTLELPWRSWVQPRVFLASLKRFLVIQIPTQLVAVLALWLLAPAADGHRPVTISEFGVVGALALAALAVVLVGPRVDQTRRRLR